MLTFDIHYKMRYVTEYLHCDEVLLESVGAEIKELSDTLSFCSSKWSDSDPISGTGWTRSTSGHQHRSFDGALLRLEVELSR
jgi:hypothetical protein